MVSMRGREMGRFSVELDLANNHDLSLAAAGYLAHDNVRRVRLRGVVDTGAARLVLPAAAVQQLGLESTSDVTVRYADGRTAKRALVDNVHLTFLDRSSVFNAVVEPERDSALVGAIVMEDLDLIVDCTQQTLTPRDPKHIISEIEYACLH